LFSLDWELLDFVRTLDQIDVSSTDEARKAKALDRISEVAEVEVQMKDINFDKSRFSKSYLKDDQFAAIWETEMQHLRQVCRSDDEDSPEQLKKRNTCQEPAYHLLTALVRVVGKGFPEDDLELIHRRWASLDDQLSWYYEVELYRESFYDEGAPHVPRLAPTWLVYKSENTT
jgi:hypothetical protein